MAASEIEAFATAVEAVVATLVGTAVLDLHGDNRIWISVSVNTYGSVRTDYEVSGNSGGLSRTGWHAGGAYDCWHLHYLKQFPFRSSAAGFE